MGISRFIFILILGLVPNIKGSEVKEKLQYKVQLIGKFQVLKKQLRDITDNIDNKTARKAISNFINEIDKIKLSSPTWLLELDKKIESLDESIDILKTKAVNVKDKNLLDSFAKVINKFKEFIEVKPVDLSEFHKADETIDLNETETFTQETFKDLIQGQEKNKLPFIVARVTDEGSPRVFYFDANSLNKHIFNDYPIYPNQSKWEEKEGILRHKEGEFGFRDTKNILTNTPLKANNINYFIINSLKDKRFDFLTSFEDLITEPNRQSFFYKNSGNTFLPIKLFKNINNQKAVSALDLSSDNKYIVAASKDDNAKIYKLDSGELLHPLSHNKAFFVKITADNQHVYTVSHDKIIKLWDIQTGQLLDTLNLKDTINHVAISSKYIVTSSHNSNKARIINLTNKQSFILTNNKPISSIAISPNDKFLIIGSDKDAKIINLNNNTHLRTLEINAEVLSIVVSNDNRLAIIVSGLDDTKINVWNIQTGQLLHSFKHDGTETIAVSPNNKLLITGSSDKTAKIWNLENWQLLNTLNYEDPVDALATSDKYITTASSWAFDHSIKIWEIE